MLEIRDCSGQLAASFVRNEGAELCKVSVLAVNALHERRMLLCKCDLLLAGQLAQVAREPASLIGDLCVQRGVNIAEVAVVAFDALIVRLELRPEYLLDLGTLPGKLPDVLLQDCVLICVLRGEFAV